MRYQRPKASGDVLAVALLVVFGLFLLFIVLLPTPQRRFNWGFGSQWECTNQNLDVSCQRK
jgi:hypothetical protein